VGCTWALSTTRSTARLAACLGVRSPSPGFAGKGDYETGSPVHSQCQGS
jgi:hypothetical protein